MSDVARIPAVIERYPAISRGAAARRVRAAAQHGLDGRQPVPADPLRLPARRRLAVQQARAGLRLRGARRASTAGTRSSGRASTASPRTRPTSRSRSSPSTPSCGRSARTATRAIPARRLLPAPRRHARDRAPARARRADRRHRRARRTDRSSLHLPEVPRPGVLRVRPGVGRGRRRGRGRCRQRRTPGARAASARSPGGRGAPRPRSSAAQPTAATFRRAAAAELEQAVVREHNAFKVELAQRAAVRGLTRSLNGVHR